MVGLGNGLPLKLQKANSPKRCPGQVSSPANKCSTKVLDNFTECTLVINFLHDSYSFRLSSKGSDWSQEPVAECKKEQETKLLTDLILDLLLIPSGVTEHAQVCASTHNRDVQRHARSQAGAQASPARIPQCREPLARACLLARLCQPPQSSESQRCMPGLYRYVLWPCRGSNRGMSVSVDTLEQLIFPRGSSHFPTLS